MKTRTILLCSGKACREHAKAYRKLRKVLTSAYAVEPVRCQKICSGPVVGCELGERWTWFEKVRKSEDRKCVVRVFEGKGLNPRAKKRRVKKRTGKRR